MLCPLFLSAVLVRCGCPLSLSAVLVRCALSAVLCPLCLSAVLVRYACPLLLDFNTSTIIFEHIDDNWYLLSGVITLIHFIKLMTLNWSQLRQRRLMNTALAMLPTKTDTALRTQPRLTEIFHHDGPTAAFNIHLESSFGVGSQWQLKWTVNQLFTWLTNFIAMGPRPHSTSSWKLSYGHSRNSAVHHMMVNLPMLLRGNR